MSFGLGDFGILLSLHCDGRAVTNFNARSIYPHRHEDDEPQDRDAFHASRRASVLMMYAARLVANTVWCEASLAAAPQRAMPGKIENPHGPVVKLTLTHDELDEKDVKFFTGISGGWPAVLSNLKSLLEGGQPLVARPC